jgi:tetratricopeptide (TPR) repeat protein
MLEQLDTEQSIYHVRLWLGEGRDDVALATLEEIHSDDPEQRREIAYLSAWCHMRLEHWTEALRLLSPLYSPGQIEDNWNDAKHKERERRAFTLFCLGNTAFNLSHYEEASQHYTQCLKVLNERRVHLPKVQIKAQCALGRTSLVSGLYAVANQHYEKALRLCKNDPDHEDLSDIYYGLCEAHRLLGTFERAYTYGKMALALYEKRNVTLSDSEGPDRTKETYIQNLLGRICLQMSEYLKANDHYMKALSLAHELRNEVVEELFAE